MQPFAVDALVGLHAFQLAADGDNKLSTWYCFTLSVARVLGVTTRAVAIAISREFPSAAGVLSVTRSESPSFNRVLSTYAQVKNAVEGAVDSLGSRKSEKFCLYPLPLVEKLLAHYAPARVSAQTLASVRAFMAMASKPVSMDLGSDPALAASASADAADGDSDVEMKQAGSASAGAAEIKVKLEPGAASLPVAAFVGGIPVIDLTCPTTLALLESDVSEQTLSSLVDNFALWQPVVEEYTVLREYGLRPQEVSVLLQEQCQRFSEYRQEIWNWSRDPSQVTQKTVGNNIRVFLLFGGFVCHSAKRHRLKPASFDMAVFGSKQVESYIMDFLHYLHGSRKLMFSSIANYLNSLVVLAKFYFADNPLADVSFSADRVDTEFVLTGLRRVRAQTNAKAKVEALQKPLHAQWLSWPECQQVRRACLAAYETAAAAAASRASAEEEDQKSPTTSKARRLLKSLVCLMFYTIAPPARCSIVRLLQWRTTLVKKRSDPSRYVIDLLNNPDAPASQHKVQFFCLLLPVLFIFRLCFCRLSNSTGARFCRSQSP